MSNDLSWDIFAKVEIRVGTIIKVDDFPNAKRPAYQLHIDFGDELGVRKSSAQITVLYSKKELLNKQIVAVVNFPKKQIANFMSECLVLGVVDDEEVTLLEPSKKTKNGLRVM